MAAKRFMMQFDKDGDKTECPNLLVSTSVGWRESYNDESKTETSFSE